MRLRHGACYTTDGVAGAAMWMPPGTSHTTTSQELALLPGMLRGFGRSLPRLLRMFSALEAEHPEEAHYYLPAIGVLPEHQGRGIGSALLQPILGRCDRERVPAYLESSNPRNIALYERHGFEVTQEGTVGDSPPFWRMWRAPRG